MTNKSYIHSYIRAIICDSSLTCTALKKYSVLLSMEYTIYATHTATRIHSPLSNCLAVYQIRILYTAPHRRTFTGHMSVCVKRATVKLQRRLWHEQIVQPNEIESVKASLITRVVTSSCICYIAEFGQQKENTTIVEL